MSAWSQTAIRNVIRNHFQSTRIQTTPAWINAVGFHVQDDGLLMVTFPHSFFQEWFVQYLQEEFEQFIRAHVPGIQAFQYQYQAQSPPRVSIFQPFEGDERFTFDRFLHNAKNEQQVMAAKLLISNPQWRGTPLLICGPQGAGKSHFLLAMANALRSEPGESPVLTPHVQDLQTLLRLQSTTREAARNHAAQAKGFLFDDVHALQDLEAGQEELRIIFDLLEDTGVPMAFTCLDKLPDPKHFNQNLRSRLEGGLILHLKRPDLDIRLQFVQEQTREKSLPLSDADILSLARRCQDFRALSKAVFQLQAQKDLRPTVNHLQFLDNVDQTQTSGSSTPSCQDIMAQTAAHFGLQMADLTSTHRRRNIVLARQIAIYMCRKVNGSSFSQIGVLFGGRNHSSIIYSFKKIERMRKENPDLDSQIEELSRQCRRL